MKPKAKTKTIDEFCNQPPGSFQKFIEEERKLLQSVEAERKERIRATRKTG